MLGSLVYKSKDGTLTMNAALDRKYSVAENLVFISVINVFFWFLALVVSLMHLQGTASIERLLPVLAGGLCVSGAAVFVAWRRRAH